MNRPDHSLRATLLVAGIWAGIILCAVTGAAVLRFGSLRSAAGVAMGQPVVVESPQPIECRASLNGVSTSRIVLRNFLDAPVNVVGSRASCSCVVVDELPVTIPASGTTAVPFTFHGYDEPMTVDVEVQFYLDVPSPPLVTSVVAVTEPSPAEETSDDGPSAE